MDLDQTAETLVSLLKELTSDGDVDVAPVPAVGAGGPAPRGLDDGGQTGQSAVWRDHLSGWTGAGAEQFRVVDEDLERLRRERESTDRELAETLEQARSAARGSLERLRSLQATVEAARAGMGPSLDTQAGRQQYAELLVGGLDEVEAILAHAQESHGRAASGFTDVAQRYGNAAV